MKDEFKRSRALTDSWMGCKKDDKKVGNRIARRRVRRISEKMVRDEGIGDGAVADVVLAFG